MSNPTQGPIIGCIADDFTGASDMASFLVKGGLRTMQLNGLHREMPTVSGVDAVVVALKTRTCSPAQAVDESTQAIQWLKSIGAQIFYFKYCSTFDSTEHGNIGPVSEAMLKALLLTQAIVCPALPANGRTVYRGHLFVYNQLLHESPLKDHPLTPMKDAKLSRLLAAQLPAQVRHDISHIYVDDLPKQHLTKQQRVARYLISDAINAENLAQLAQTMVNEPPVLWTGGSELGAYLGQYALQRGFKLNGVGPGDLRREGTQTLLLAGSCSQATRNQVAFIQSTVPSFFIDADELASGTLTVNTILEWIAQVDAPAVLVYSSTEPDAVLENQVKHGTATIAYEIEQLLANVAVQSGIKNMVVAGGETSGAVVKAMNIRGFHIGDTICPGVPLMQSIDADKALFALKSGNFGDEDFFAAAVLKIKQLKGRNNG